MSTWRCGWWSSCDSIDFSRSVLCPSNTNAQRSLGWPHFLTKEPKENGSTKPKILHQCHHSRTDGHDSHDGTRLYHSWSWKNRVQKVQNKVLAWWHRTQIITNLSNAIGNRKKSTPSSQNFVPRLWKHHVLPERIFAPYLWPNFDHFHGDVGESAAEPRKTSGKKALHWKESQDVTGINPRHQPWLCGRWVQLQPSFATWSTFASDITWPKQSKCTRLINHIQL